MLKVFAVMLGLVAVASAAELPTKKYLNLAAIKTMVAVTSALNVSIPSRIAKGSGSKGAMPKGAPTLMATHPTTNATRPSK